MFIIITIILLIHVTYSHKLLSCSQICKALHHLVYAFLTIIQLFSINVLVNCFSFLIIHITFKQYMNETTSFLTLKNPSLIVLF